MKTKMKGKNFLPLYPQTFRNKRKKQLGEEIETIEEATIKLEVEKKKKKNKKRK